MRVCLLFALVLGACAPENAARAPAKERQMIVSTNPCIDTILVELVQPERILSVSHYSQNIGSSSMDVDLARQFPANGGTAEEIIALRPDIVLLGSHTPRATLSAVQDAGIPVELISVPNNVADSLKQIDQIAAATDSEEKADALKGNIKAAINVSISTEDAARPGLLIWQAGGLVPGVGTLIDDMIRIAGFRNASADYGLAMWDILPLEPVAKHPPNIILSPVNGKSGESRNIRLREQFLAEFGGQITKVDIPENLLHCGGPTIIGAMKLLNDVKTKYNRQVGG